MIKDQPYRLYNKGHYSTKQKNVEFGANDVKKNRTWTQLFLGITAKYNKRDMYTGFT
jgi:hypothetical protein